MPNLTVCLTWLYDYPDCMTTLTVWLPWLYDYPDCMPTLTVWLPWLYDYPDCMATLTVWLPWLYDYPDCMATLTVWLPWLYDYPDWGFSVLFPQLYGKCQGKTRKDGARPALFLIFCVVLWIVRFVLFCVLFVCICILYYCYRVATQMQLTNQSFNKINYPFLNVWYLVTMSAATIMQHSW
jgi:hypothetical protein